MFSDSVVLDSLFVVAPFWYGRFVFDPKLVMQFPFLSGNHLAERERADCLTLFVFCLFCDVCVLCLFLVVWLYYKDISSVLG